MHVALVHSARLPVTKYGGTERVVVWLARGLGALGLDVTVICGRGSRLRGFRVIEVDSRRAESTAFDPEALVPADVDLCHYHIPVYQPPGRPFLETIHGNVQPTRRRQPNTVYLSADHARRHGGTTFVYNGLDPAEYQYSAVKEDYLLFLGRLHRVKGYREAIAAAHRRRERLVVAGGWRPIWRPGVRFVGRVEDRRKTALLAGARALLAPVQWDEPFGLAIIEALASGTPVIGSPRGALPELVTPQVGGLASTVEEIAALLERLKDWPAERCRARVLEHFTYMHMARAYVEQYAHLLDHGTLKRCE